MHCRYSFNSNDMPACDRRLKVAAAKGCDWQAQRPLTHRVRQGDGGSFLGGTVMLVREATKTIPGGYWTSHSSLRRAPVSTSWEPTRKTYLPLIIALGPEKQATGDRDRHLPELANSALRTIDAPGDAPGRSHDCLTHPRSNAGPRSGCNCCLSADADSDLNRLVARGEILRK